MIQGIYTSVAGMIPRVNQERNIASNLANQTTYGFKKNDIFLRELITAQYALDHALGIERTETPEDVRVDFTQGTFDHTNLPTDFALNGSGFFRVADTDGTIYLTRNGRFYLDSTGSLINSQGMYLLNDQGEPITLLGGELAVMGDGTILENGVFSDMIGIVDIAQADYQALQNIGGGFFIRPVQVNELPMNQQTTIVQGYLEDSNVEPVMAMVDMIEAFRMFELGQKSIQIQDGSLQRIVNEVGIVQ